MQNPAFYGSWPLNINQYAWSPEVIQQYQNMLLTDPTLQQQMPRHRHLQHCPPHQPLSLPPSPLRRQLIPQPHRTTPNNHPAHQAHLPCRQPGSPTTNTTTAILYMGTHCFAKFNQPPGAEHATFMAWILFFSQLPSCFGKAKRSLR